MGSMCPGAHVGPCQHDSEVLGGFPRRGLCVSIVAPHPCAVSLLVSLSLSLSPGPSILCGVGGGGASEGSKECGAPRGTRACCPPSSDDKFGVSPWAAMKSPSQRRTGRVSWSPDHRDAHTFTQPRSQPCKTLWMLFVPTLAGAHTLIDRTPTLVSLILPGKHRRESQTHTPLHVHPSQAHTHPCAHPSHTAHKHKSQAHTRHGHTCTQVTLGASHFSVTHTPSILLFAQHPTTYSLSQTVEVTHTGTELQTQPQTQKEAPGPTKAHSCPHRGGPPAVFDWFFEAARPASLQEGELGASGGGGDVEGRSGALNLEARSPTSHRSPHPATVSPRLQGPGMLAGSWLPWAQGQSPQGKRLSWPGVGGA